jgi:hypothetical protein
MTYMQDLEQTLRAWLESFAAGDISTDAFIAMLKSRILRATTMARTQGRDRRHKALARPLNPAGRSGATKTGALRTLRSIAEIISRNLSI